MSVSTVAQTVAGSLTGALEQVKHFVGNLAGRTVTLIRNYPGLMQDNRAVAVTTFLGVNYLVLQYTNLIAAHVEERVYNPLNKKLTSKGETVSHVIVSLSVGGSAYCASALLSNVAEYPLTRGALLIISVFAVFARYVGVGKELAKAYAARQQLKEAKKKLIEEERIEEERIASIPKFILKRGSDGLYTLPHFEVPGFKNVGNMRAAEFNIRAGSFILDTAAGILPPGWTISK